MLKKSEGASGTGLPKFTLFETVYVILLNIHKRQPNQQRQHFVRQKKVLHSLALAVEKSHKSTQVCPICFSLFSKAEKTPQPDKEVSPVKGLSLRRNPLRLYTGQRFAINDLDLRTVTQDFT